MALTPATRVGPYEVLSPLGAGGMGEVYRARDTRLGRDVALKVLPAAFAQDQDRVTRFRREAQILAALNHPNIAAIYGLEESDGILALAMEHVDGEDLSSRLERGAIPVADAVEVARQIAIAFEEAHAKGIVHRDLKPANVKLTPDGKVKVLDFGLARALVGETEAAASDVSKSPTLAHTGTAAGMILGTAAYMSPEQARGKPVDKRADVWSFGVVLYEMLTGDHLFAAETATDTLAAVLTRPIDPARLPAATPLSLRQLVRRCLQRDPRNRLHDMGDARIVLDEIAAGEDATPAPAAARRSPLPWLAGLLLLGIAAALVSRRVALAPVAAPDAGFPSFARLTYQSGLESSPSLSPDGEFVAYSAIDGGDRDILLLRVGGQRVNNLTEDSPADDDHPAFSPDGRSIAFRSERGGGGIWVMGATGESARRLTDVGDNPAWSPDGREIVFATEGVSDPHARQKTAELWVVPAAGGQPRRIFAGDAVQPCWSPHGERIAYWSVDQGVRDVWTIARDGSDPQRVTNRPSVDWNPVWSKDGTQLYFESDRGGVMNPWRIAIDEKTGRLRGEPEPIHLPTSWSGQFSLSADGRRLAYRTSEMTAEVRRLPIDVKSGRITGPIERMFQTAIPAIGLDVTADGWIAFRTVAMQEDIYAIRVDGTGLHKLTDDEAKDRNPVWSPDGSQLAFYSNRSGRYEVWTLSRDGSNLHQRTSSTVADPGSSTFFPLWAPDGRSLVASANRKLIRFPLQDAPVAVAEAQQLPVERGDANFVLVQSWSPDGKTLAGVRIGPNGQVLDGLLVYALESEKTRVLPVNLPPPRSNNFFPTLAWLPDSRRGVVRWGDRILLVDTTSGTITTLLDGLPPEGGILRLSGDGRWLYMLDSRDEADLWLASR